MSSCDLTKKRCVPCQGGVPPLGAGEIEPLLKQLSGWQVVDNHHLFKTFQFPDGQTTIKWIDRLWALAEEEGHHPNVNFTWGKAEVSIWTHKIDGLTESDFVLAAKADAIGI